MDRKCKVGEETLLEKIIKYLLLCENGNKYSFSIEKMQRECFNGKLRSISQTP